MFEPIHKHLLIKATIGKPITDPFLAKRMLKDLVARLGMKPVTEPQVAYVKDEGNEGLTGSINLATSHIAFHVWDKKKLLMMDVYSCCDFSTDKVLAFIMKEFGGFGKVEGMVIDRENFDVIYIKDYDDAWEV
jgi:S-adenosylmethionine/arginine decarboxylase-like enzyme